MIFCPIFDKKMPDMGLFLCNSILDRFRKKEYSIGDVNCDKNQNHFLEDISMKKKVLAIVVTVAMALSLVACGGSKKEDQGTDKPVTVDPVVVNPVVDPVVVDPVVTPGNDDDITLGYGDDDDDDDFWYNPDDDDDDDWGGNDDGPYVSVSTDSEDWVLATGTATNNHFTLHYPEGFSYSNETDTNINIATDDGMSVMSIACTYSEESLANDIADGFAAYRDAVENFYGATTWTDNGNYLVGETYYQGYPVIVYIYIGEHHVVYVETLNTSYETGFDFFCNIELN